MTDRQAAGDAEVRELLVAADRSGDASLHLSEWQRTAIEAPTLLAEECAHPRYGHVTPFGTVVLTVDAGYE